MLRRAKAFVISNDNLKYFLIGASGALGFAPFNLYPVFIIIYAWFLSNAYKSAASIRLSFFFFFGFYVANLYWLAFPLTIDFAKHFALIPIAITLIPGYLAAQTLVSVILIKYFCGVFVKSIVFPIVLTAILYLQGQGSFGFPWTLPAYIWNAHEVFMQTLSIYGAYGLTFVTISISSFIGAAVVYYRQNDIRSCAKYLCASALLFFGMCIFGIARLANNPTEYSDVRARVVQPNIRQNELEKRKILDKLLKLSGNNSDIDLLIWPEASVPYLYSENMHGLNRLLSEPLVKQSSCLIAGAVRKDAATSDIYNSAIFIDHFGRNIYNYDKVHLVPFGEYIPFRSILPFESVASDIGDFCIGNNRCSVIQINNLKITLAICYEAVFSLTQTLFDEMQTDLIINLTNDGWFGFTTQPFQHLQIVRARAVETGIPLIRATNIGVSAVFDPLGREIKHIPFGSTGYMDFNVPKRLSKRTLFSKLHYAFINR